MKQNVTGMFLGYTSPLQNVLLSPKSKGMTVVSEVDMCPQF